MKQMVDDEIIYDNNIWICRAQLFNKCSNALRHELIKNKNRIEIHYNIKMPSAYNVTT